VPFHPAASISPFAAQSTICSTKEAPRDLLRTPLRCMRYYCTFITPDRLRVTQHPLSGTPTATPAVSHHSALLPSHAFTAAEP